MRECENTDQVVRIRPKTGTLWALVGKTTDDAIVITDAIRRGIGDTSANSMRVTRHLVRATIHIFPNSASL